MSWWFCLKPNNGRIKSDAERLRPTQEQTLDVFIAESKAERISLQNGLAQVVGWCLYVMLRRNGSRPRTASRDAMKRARLPYSLGKKKFSDKQSYWVDHLFSCVMLLS